ncbi:MULTISPECIES: ribosome hibernation-promoting factor, HPF/YfiA family [unclassified Rhodococcus (in: high G+C Gram-positive bacteria)]|uniref:ribosome hibernation-promoting factor, HPF/YfiA family n=1 Tax=unclassified Rhodococcus (in: high G+C Gram-positive bacteria) TaxID=192944 RepID=UPI0009E6762E|nr:MULTISPECIES: ribosome-associated translation inhibitor RaiA [unclassified Rhodococcus (in: high G+C Gram-positive bacteria)]
MTTTSPATTAHTSTHRVHAHPREAHGNVPDQNAADRTDTTDTSSDSVYFDDAPTIDTTDSSAGDEPTAEVVVKGRNVEIPEHFRLYVSQKLARLERFDPTIHLFDVELFHERNRRQSKSCQRVEITARGKGPVVRAEACADSFYAALESATTKLESRLRRTKDRRKVHYGEKRPVSVAEATAALIEEADTAPVDSAPVADEPAVEGPGTVVRIKEHSAVPMTVDDALYEMELVGHDFFLFHDKESDLPSVVYRRHAFDYGLLRLT